MNKKKAKFIALILSLQLLLTGCYDPVPLEFVNLGSSEFQGTIELGVCSDSEQAGNIDQPELELHNVGNIAIRTDRRTFDVNDVNVTVYYGFTDIYHPEYGEGANTSEPIFDRIDIGIKAEIGVTVIDDNRYSDGFGIYYKTTSYELSRHSDYVGNREKYLIDTRGYDTVKGLPVSFESFAFSEEIIIPEECFVERSDKIELYLYVEAIMLDGSVMPLNTGYRMRYDIGYIRKGNTVVLFDDPYDAINYYR